jgi:hypothetical protein
MDSDSNDQRPTWSEITRRGLTAPLPSAKLRPIASVSMVYSTVKTEIVFEVEGITNTQRSKRAAGVLKRALNPNAVLFEVPKDALNPPPCGGRDCTANRRHSGLYQPRIIP